MADSENCGFMTSLCPYLRLWPGLYDIYLCLRPKNWSVMLSGEKLGIHFYGVVFLGGVVLNNSTSTLVGAIYESKSSGLFLS